MKLGALLDLAHISCPLGAEDIEVGKIVTDSRKITEGCMFICVRGLHFDGHDFINYAIEAGASVIVAERVCDAWLGGAAIVTVDNTRRASALLYNAWFGLPSQKMRFIGITGTNGKTTVSCMIFALLEASGYRCGLIGTLGIFSSGLERLEDTVQDPLANMTTPDVEALYFALSKLAEQGTDIVVMEVSSHALALCKTDGIFFDTAVFTNLTQDHLDFHHTMEDYFLAKKKLFNNCRRAIVNIDDRYGKRIFEAFPDRCISCSMAGEGDLCASKIALCGLEGSSFTIGKRDGESLDVRLSLLGRFNVMNALECFGAASEYLEERNVEIGVVKGFFSLFSGVLGRMEKAVDNGDFCAFIDYAHTPDALEKLLRTAREFGGERRIVLLFGCGGDRDRGKRREMGQIASRLADFVIITSDNSRSEDREQIFSDILRGIDKESPYILVRERRDAIEYAVSHARAGDIILLAGKGHEKYEIDASGRHYFDEREILQDAISKYRNKGLLPKNSQTNSGKESQ